MAEGAPFHSCRQTRHSWEVVVAVVALQSRRQTRHDLECLSCWILCSWQVASLCMLPASCLLSSCFSFLDKGGGWSAFGSMFPRGLAPTFRPPLPTAVPTTAAVTLPTAAALPVAVALPHTTVSIGAWLAAWGRIHPLRNVQEKNREANGACGGLLHAARIQDQSALQIFGETPPTAGHLAREAKLTGSRVSLQRISDIG